MYYIKMCYRKQKTEFVNSASISSSDAVELIFNDLNKQDKFLFLSIIFQKDQSTVMQFLILKLLYHD